MTKLAESLVDSIENEWDTESNNIRALATARAKVRDCPSATSSLSPAAIDTIQKRREALLGSSSSASGSLSSSKQESLQTSTSTSSSSTDDDVAILSWLLGQ